MDFVPQVAPRSHSRTEPALWFTFHREKLLVKWMNDAATLPCMANLRPLGLEPTRTQYLGTLDGHACYAAELCGIDAAPEDMSFEGLRGLYGHMEEDLFWLSGRAFQIMNWDRNTQFCSRCGTPTDPMPHERAKLCPACGLTDYPPVSPAIIVAVVKDGQILLAHGRRSRPNMYSVLAGFVEPGESLEECVRREVKEEVGVEVRNIQYFGSQSWPFPHSLMIGFTAEYAAGSIEVDESEIVDAGWFKVDELPLIPGKISISRQLIDWYVDTYQ